MAARARGRGSRYGIDGAILETRLGSIRKVLETTTPEAGRHKPEVWNVAFGAGAIDRKSTRLNSSHANISYAVFCLKKKNATTSKYRFSLKELCKYSGSAQHSSVSDD